MTVRSHIRGLSERRSLPVLGKVRTGTKAVNRNACKDHGRVGPQADCQRCTHPVMLDHFIVDDTPAGRQFRQLFGDGPDSLPIEFPVDQEEIVAAHNLELYGDGLLKCRGDGYTAMALVSPKVYGLWLKQKQASPDLPPPPEMWARSGFAPSGEPDPERVEIPCLGAGYDGAAACPMYGDHGCSASMHLKFIVRGFPALGVWQLDTGSVMSIERVLSYLALLREWRGQIARIPLRLSLSKTRIRGRDFFPLRLDLDMPEEAIKALMAGEALPELPDPSDEPPIDHGDAIDVEVMPSVEGDPQPLNERPFDEDEPAKAQALLDWARDSLGIPESTVFTVLGIAGVDGIVRMGIPEAQAALEKAHADSGLAHRPDAEDEPVVTRLADLFRWANGAYRMQPKEVIAALEKSTYPEVEAWAKAEGWPVIVNKVKVSRQVHA